MWHAVYHVHMTTLNQDAPVYCSGFVTGSWSLTSAILLPCVLLNLLALRSYLGLFYSIGQILYLGFWCSALCWELCLWTETVSDQKRKRVLKREGMLRIMFQDRLVWMCMLGTLGTLGADLIYLMSNGKCTLRALLGQSPAECPAGQNPPQWMSWLVVTVSDSVSTKAVIQAYVCVCGQGSQPSPHEQYHCQALPVQLSGALVVV